MTKHNAIYTTIVTSVLKDVCVEIWAIKLRFLLISKNILKNIATARS